MANSKYVMEFEIEDQEYVLLQPGVYQFTVDSVEYGDYNGSVKIPACGKVTVNLHVDTNAGRAFLNNNFYVCKECSGLIAAFFKSIGDLKDGQKTFSPNWDGAVGKTGLVEVVNREYNGNQYNNVKRFLPPQKKQQPAKKKTWSDTEW